MTCVKKDLTEKVTAKMTLVFVAIFVIIRDPNKYGIHILGIRNPTLSDASFQRVRYVRTSQQQQDVATTIT